LDEKGQAVDFWEFFWLLIWTYIFVAYLMLLFQIIADVFRDRDLGGFAKALWMIALIFVPFLSALIYLIARGRGMAERRATMARQAQAETEQYIQSVASKPNPADEIASAKGLLDDGTITQGEYERLKEKALA
jgi:Phospholipase_D-nuclease N-terminal